jgi:hypothetical protein
MCGVAEGIGDVTEAGEDAVFSCCTWHGNLCGEPGECVADAHCPGFPHPYSVAAVGFHGWCDVPAVGGVWSPGTALSGFFVDEDSCAGWGHWVSIKIECAVNLGVGR